jgi:PPOX class probable F420-dependent enzyme
MLNDSIREFLNGRHYATLATQNEDGSIHLTPVWYLFQDDRFYISSGSYARKYKNILERPGVSIMVDSRGRQGNEEWVSVTGNAEIIEGEKSQEIHANILKRYLTDMALEDPVVGGGFTAIGELAISVRPETVKSWKLRDSDVQYFGGVLKQSPNKWFHPVD